MKILAIESSCDETSAALVEKTDNKILVHSNITATSLLTHAKTGGIIPENAAREQVKYIIPVLKEAIGKNFEFDSIAVTCGPGLIGSLLVGVETAKTLSFALNIPLIPVNHLLAHLFANFIDRDINEIKYPFIGLIVSGGHTDLLYFEAINKYKWLGGTRDDAAGEALDKIGRLLGLSYPAGPEIEKRARIGEKTKIRFKAPLIGDSSLDFSFSGLKTEVMRYLVNNESQRENEDFINGVCFAVQKAVVDVLNKKAVRAAKEFNCATILLGGGVSANQTLVGKIKDSFLTVYVPERKYCTDNAAMIGAYAVLNPNHLSWKKVNANPELYFI